MRLLTKQTPSPVSPKRGSPEESHRSFTNHLQTDFIMFKTMIVKSIGGVLPSLYSCYPRQASRRR